MRAISVGKEAMRRGAGFFRLVLLLRSFRRPWRLLRDGVPPSDLSGSKGNKIFLDRLRLEVDPFTDAYILDGYCQARALAETAGAKFSRHSNGEVMVNVDGVLAFVETRQDLLILDEVFVRQTYGMSILKPSLVIDVGMNVGYSTLWFARHNSAVVVGYEPFERTYRQARRNIDLNPAISERITTRGVGLANGSRRIRAPYSYSLKGDAGIYGIPKDRTLDDMTSDEIQLVDASSELAPIIKGNPQREVVLKLDCEGAEHEILESLSKSGLLSRIKIIMMEWHIRDRSHSLERLESILDGAGFRRTQTRYGHDVGFIIAMRDSA